MREGAGEGESEQASKWELKTYAMEMCAHYTDTYTYIHMYMYVHINAPVIDRFSIICIMLVFPLLC